MKIEVKGVIETIDSGINSVAVVVCEGVPYVYKTHQVGVDIVVNRGRIITFLSALYEIPPGKIGWPEHILIKEDV